MQPPPRLDLPRRFRRTRRTDWVRRLVRETHLTPNDLIWPLFVQEGSCAHDPIPSMPGVYRLSVDEAVRAALYAAELFIPCLALFPFFIPSMRDPLGEEATRPNNLICRACRAIKAAVPNIGVMVDVA